MAPKHQRCNNIRNFEYNNYSTLTAIYDNNNNNVQLNNDSRIVKQNIDTSSISQDHPRNANPPIRNNNADLIIFHQNIRGLYNEIDELLNIWTAEYPHILCLTEHHLRDHEINSTYIKDYNLGTKYCRKSHKYGGVSIFVHETLLFSTVEFNEFCKDQDLEVCAVKLHISSFVFCILCVYRPPTGNFSHFLSSLQSILNQSYTNSINTIICGEINMNYLDNTNNKLQLDFLLTSYDLYSTVDFPARINNCSSAAIDNIFTDKFKNTNFTIKPLTNGFLDHDAQILILHNIKIQNLKAHHYTKRLINEFTISEFKLNLSYESWNEIFTEDYVDSLFNSFLNAI
jgi:exonuclease III